LAGRQRETTFRAVAAYFELVRQRAGVVTAEEALRVAQSHTAQIEATTTAGLTFAGDAARVRAARDRAALNLSRAQSEQRLAAARLAEILRLDPAVELTPPELELAPTSLGPAGELGALIAKAVAVRPEMDEASARQESARLAQRAADRGAWLPSVGAQVGVGGLGGGPRGSTLGRDFDTSVDTAFGLSWRIGPGGLFDGNRQREASARARQSDLERERTELAIRRQVVEQHTRVQALGRQLELARTALAAAERHRAALAATPRNGHGRRFGRPAS
jgi:outer membrane protein TolC